MAVVLPQQGKKSFLADIKGSSNPYQLKLFQNALVPGQTTVIGSFTEANFSGYVLAIPAFGAITVDTSGRASMTASPMAFPHSGGPTANTIYGYYLVHSGTNEVLFCEAFATPKSMSVFGDSITITPTMTLDQG